MLLDGILNPGVHHGLSEDPVLRGICHGLEKKRVLTQDTRGATRTRKAPGLWLPGDWSGPTRNHSAYRAAPSLLLLIPHLGDTPHPTEPLWAGQAGAKPRVLPWACAQTQEGPGLSAGHVQTEMPTAHTLTPYALECATHTCSQADVQPSVAAIPQFPGSACSTKFLNDFLKIETQRTTFRREPRPSTAGPALWITKLPSGPGHGQQNHHRPDTKGKQSPPGVKWGTVHRDLPLTGPQLPATGLPELWGCCGQHCIPHTPALAHGSGNQSSASQVPVWSTALQLPKQVLWPGHMPSR